MARPTHARTQPARTTEQLVADDSPLTLPLIRETVEANPGLMAPTNPETIDRSAMFLTYLAFLGDPHRTAAALMIDPGRVVEAARFEGWDKKVAHLRSVQSEMGPDEFLRELNRVVNFVQAVRLRAIMDRVLQRLVSDTGLDAFLTTYGRDHSNTSPKALLDVVKCCEAVHRLTYTALGDVPSKSTLDQGDSAKGSVALSILGALSANGAGTAEPSRVIVGTCPETPETKSTFPVDIQPLPTDRQEGP